MRNSDAYAAAAALGVLAGMRSMAAPAVLGRLSRNGSLAAVKGPLTVITKPGFAGAAMLLSLGELVADKLPITPNRTAAGPLLGRALMGGLSGAAVCSSKRRSVPIGAFIGAAAAIAAAYGAYELRKAIGQKTRLPDAVIGIAEDVMVGSLGAALLSRLTDDAELLAS
jgi:uncharacterized membrane protein